ncbi:putative ZWF1-glucose-6-phosphate dehydrogenase [Dimargaris cristalligena]|uniref:Glucose-6-phosphate 1-dehydrogenase n=1 Tax=Dimargaris cristalligena TaxID=215637 RepID=A0A4P9ZPX5_9FUNG|nr:putative ZWF1-glucose-6-phosphate dehydrogenase [Dimargaris cristalligena]|eukprot:RKP34400.1 putative ZWF1-glucose-6-phosphate dehydrogenase [Dimargaris cristalligena]
MSYDQSRSENPGKDAASTVIVVIGASGDLAKKKTYPALFGLFRNGFLPDRVHIIGYARSKLDKEAFRARITSEKLKDAPKEQLAQFLDICDYVSGQYGSADDFGTLNKVIEHHEARFLDQAKQTNSGVNNDRRVRVFYMATPPSVFVPVAKSIKAGAYSPDAHNRIVIEKPFGRDLATSRQFSEEFTQLYRENEIYRIDHYLGKEMVKNMPIIRFANLFFESIWNREHIDNVQITFKEAFGTQGRGGYFDEYGVIRDVMQNHMVQMLCVMAMEKPRSLDADDVRSAKADLLRSIPPIKLEDVILGQYTASADGKEPGYTDDKTVPEGSLCATYASMVLFINNERWRGVPIIMKAGKAMDEAKVEVRVQFKDVTDPLYQNIARNELIARVGPTEAVYLKIMNKRPGLVNEPVISELDLSYRRRYSDAKIPEAYEALLLEILAGDQSHFIRGDELDAAWEIFTPLLHQIENEKIKPRPYAYGTRGPEGADDFIQKYGYKRRSQAYHWPTDLGRPIQEVAKEYAEKNLKS